MNRKMTSEHSSRARGKLKIGDDWNAIIIIALSQTSPLKAIAHEPTPAARSISYGMIGVVMRHRASRSRRRKHLW
jgi:hypothetical protein